MSNLDLSALTVGGIAPSYVTVDAAAALMSVSHWTVRRWITNGALPARKMPSGGLRVAVADLEKVGEAVYPGKR
jgi:excisionase family DNA binding protein